MNLKVNDDCLIKTPAHNGDAGYDVAAFGNPNIVGTKYGDAPFYTRIDYIEYDTGLIIEPSEGFHTLLFPRSSISQKNLYLCNSVGLIDNGYRGTLKLRFKYVAQPSDMLVGDLGGVVTEIDSDRIYHAGDKIGQLVFMKTTEADISVVDNFVKTCRNSGGFGSTGL